MNLIHRRVINAYGPRALIGYRAHRKDPLLLGRTIGLVDLINAQTRNVSLEVLRVNHNIIEKLNTPFYCQYERGPCAATATAEIGAGGLLGPGWKSAGRRGVEPAFILQDLMHSRFAGSRGDGVEGELEQRAGEGPLSCDSDDAAPARDIGRTQSRANGSVRTCSSCQEPQEGGRLGTPAATNLLFEMITEAIPTVCRFSSLVSFIIFRK